MKDQYSDQDLTPSQRYNLRHPDRRRAYYEKNKDKIARRTKLWREANLDRIKEKNRDWYAANGDLKSQKQSAQRKEIRKAIVEAGGGACVKCGYSSDIRALQIDHVFGGGSMEHKTGRRITQQLNGIPEALRRLRAGELQILCANCNVIKRDEENEYRLSPRSRHKNSTETARC